MPENKSPEPAASGTRGEKQALPLCVEERPSFTMKTLNYSVGSRQAPAEKIKPQTSRKYAYDMSKSQGAQCATNVPDSSRYGKPIDPGAGLPNESTKAYVKRRRSEEIAEAQGNYSPTQLDKIREEFRRRKSAGRAVSGAPQFAQRAQATKDVKDVKDVTEEIEIPWPTMGQAAFYALPGEIVRLIEPCTEADPVAILVQLLAGFGNSLGAAPYYVADGQKHYPNLFATLVGQSSRGRKGTALNHALRFLEMADSEWCEEHNKSGISSGEGLIWKVRDPIFHPVFNKITKLFEEEMEDPGVEDKRLLVTENEFARVLRVMDREGNTLSDVLRCAWDHRDLETLVKNSPAKATNPHISIIGHITQEELKRELAECELFNGFANRFLWLLVKRSKHLPHGGVLPVAEVQALSRNWWWKLLSGNELKIERFGFFSEPFDAL